MMICNDLNNHDNEGPETYLHQNALTKSFTDKELIQLYQYRVKNIDEGLDEAEYNKRKYNLTFGLEPE